MLFVTLRQRLQVFLAGHTHLAWVLVTLSRSFMKSVGNHSYKEIAFLFGLGSAVGHGVLQDEVARANMTFSAPCNWTYTTAAVQEDQPTIAYPHYPYY